MSRNQRLVRELRLLQLLECRHGRTLNELAAEMGVCQRTIRRDLEAFEEAGIALVDEGSEQRRRWRVYNWRKEAA